MTEGNLYFLKQLKAGEITEEQYMAALGQFIQSRVEGTKVLKHQQLEADVRWAVNSSMDGDAGWAFLESHAAAVSFIAQLFMSGRVSAGENL